MQACESVFAGSCLLFCKNLRSKFYTEHAHNRHIIPHEKHEAFYSLDLASKQIQRSTFLVPLSTSFQVRTQTRHLYPDKFFAVQLDSPLCGGKAISGNEHFGRNMTKHLQYRQYLLFQEPFLFLNSRHNCRKGKKKKVQLQYFHILNKFCSAEKKKKNIKPKCHDNNCLCLPRLFPFSWFPGWTNRTSWGLTFMNSAPK